MVNTVLKNKMIQFILIVFIDIVGTIQSYASLPQEHQSRLVLSTQSKPIDRHMIVLIHGLLRSSLSMWPLKIHLKKRISGSFL